MYEVSKDGRLGLADITLDKFAEKIEARIRRRKYHPPLLILGPVGVGKTEGIASVAKKLGIGYRQLRMANYQETDLIGLPKIAENGKDAKGSVRYVVKWVQQGFLPDVSNGDPEVGLLVFDEITNANAEVQAACWQLMDSSRSVGDYKLPDGWLIVAAGNGPEDGGNFHSVSGALLGRCEGFRCSVDLDSWKKWAINNGIHQAITAYVTAFPDSLWKWNPNESIQGGEKFPQPRMWALASDNLMDAEAENGGNLLTPESLRMEVSGYIGDVETSKFAAFYALQSQMIQIEDIEQGKAEKSISSLKREVVYLEIDGIVLSILKNAQEYMKTKNDESFTKIVNCMNWVMGIADTSLDIAMSVFAMLGKAGANTWLMFTGMNYDKLNSNCPGYKEFYKKHIAVYREYGENSNK